MFNVYLQSLFYNPVDYGLHVVIFITDMVDTVIMDMVNTVIMDMVDTVIMDMVDNVIIPSCGFTFAGEIGTGLTITISPLRKSSRWSLHQPNRHCLWS